MVHTSFATVILGDRIRPIHDMSLKSTLNNLFSIKGKIVHFVQLSDLHMRVRLPVVDILADPLLI